MLFIPQLAYIYLPTSTYLHLPTYLNLPTSTYLPQLTYIYLPTSTYLHLPTYLYLPTYLHLLCEDMHLVFLLLCKLFMKSDFSYLEEKYRQPNGEDQTIHI